MRTRNQIDRSLVPRNTARARCTSPEALAALEAEFKRHAEVSVEARKKAVRTVAARIDSPIQQRLRRLKQATDLTNKELAAIFGVDESTFKAWLHGINRPAPDCLVALDRFEHDRTPKLSPRIDQSTVKAFYVGLANMA